MKRRAALLVTGLVASLLMVEPARLSQALAQLPALQDNRFAGLQWTFVRIRYYGFLANRDRAEKIERCRQLIREQPTDETKTIDSTGPSINMHESLPVARRCPACKSGTMAVLSVFAVGPDNAIVPVKINDTS